MTAVCSVEINRKVALASASHVWNATHRKQTDGEGGAIVTADLCLPDGLAASHMLLVGEVDPQTRYFSTGCF